jgi:hypothetical protein
MANIKSDYAAGKLPSKIAQGGEVVALYYEINLAAAPVLNDTIELGPLPGGHVPVDYTLDCDDLDTNGTPTIALSLGLLNSGKTDLSTAAADGGAVWASGITSAQAGGFTRNAGRILNAVQAAETDRAIALKVTTAAATFAAGKARLTVLARAVP